jgi:hypothetical protein
MTTHDELYADGISQINVGGGVVRVDLVSLSPTERDANNNPKATFRQRLIFSVEGFVNSVEVMQKALQRVVDTGQRKPSNGVRAPAPPVPAQPRPRKGVHNSKH